MKHVAVMIPMLAMLCGCDKNPALEWQRKEEARDAISAKVQDDIAELNRRFDALERRVMKGPDDTATKIAWEIVVENQAMQRERELVGKVYEKLLRMEEVKKMQSITINGVEIDVAKVLEDALKKMTEGGRP